MRTPTFAGSALLFLAVLACRDDTTQVTGPDDTAAPPPPPPSATAAAAAAAAPAFYQPTEPAATPSNAAPALALAANTWHTLTPMPSDRLDLAARVVTNSAGQSVVYAIGGSNFTFGSQSKVQAYNVATGTWTTRAPLPVPLMSSNGAGVIGGKIYISGGFVMKRVTTPALYRYDPVANTWTRRHDMPTDTEDGVTGVINGKMYVLTSCQDQEACFVSSNDRLFFRYDPAADGWTALTPPAAQHSGGAGAVINGKFYVTGGCTGDPLDRELDVYNPATNAWTVKASLPSLLCAAAAATSGGKLYVFGGDVLDPAHTVARTTRVYDPGTNVWTTKASMPEARSHGAAVSVVLNGQAGMVVVGGNGAGLTKLAHNNVLYIP